MNLKLKSLTFNRYRLNDPFVEAMQLKPGMEDDWVALDQAGKTLCIAASEADARRAVPHAYRFAPIVRRKGLDGQPLYFDDWIVTDGDGVYYRVDDATFHRLFSPAKTVKIADKGEKEHDAEPASLVTDDAEAAPAADAGAAGLTDGGAQSPPAATREDAGSAAPAADAGAAGFTDGGAQSPPAATREDAGTAAPAPDPLDHDFSGKKGGSLKGKASTAAKGAVRKRAKKAT